MKTLRNFTSMGARHEWDAIYAEKGKIKSMHIKGDSPGVVDSQLEGFNKHDRQLLLVVQLSKGFFKSKYSAQLHQLMPMKSLSWRHNLYVFLRNTYANGDELCKEVQQLQHAEDREERMRTYRIEERPFDLWHLLKDIKETVVMKPVLLAFSSVNRSWEQQREFFVSALVDYEQQIKAMEVEYDHHDPDREQLQSIFVRFKVSRVPTWLLVTPAKREGKITIQLTRFENYRAAYFERQQSQGRPPMSAQNPRDVEEAFNSFVLWGLKQVAAVRPEENISL